MEIIAEAEEGCCEILSKNVGAGDRTPLLRQIELTERKTG
jgi:hypothetical protein